MQLDMVFQFRGTMMLILLCECFVATKTIDFLFFNRSEPEFERLNTMQKEMAESKLSMARWGLRDVAMKIFDSNSPKIGNFSWSWPFVDVFFYRVRVQRAELVGDLPYSVALDWLLPLKPTAMRMHVGAAPRVVWTFRRTDATLTALFDSSWNTRCVASFYNHVNEKQLEQPSCDVPDCRAVPCALLAPFLPLVQRVTEQTKRRAVAITLALLHLSTTIPIGSLRRTLVEANVDEQQICGKASMMRAELSFRSLGSHAACDALAVRDGDNALALRSFVCHGATQMLPSMKERQSQFDRSVQHSFETYRSLVVSLNIKAIGCFDDLQQSLSTLVDDLNVQVPADCVIACARLDLSLAAVVGNETLACRCGTVETNTLRSSAACTSALSPFAMAIGPFGVGVSNIDTVGTVYRVNSADDVLSKVIVPNIASQWVAVVDDAVNIEMSRVQRGVQNELYCTSYASANNATLLYQEIGRDDAAHLRCRVGCLRSGYQSAFVNGREQCLCSLPPDAGEVMLELMQQMLSRTVSPWCIHTALEIDKSLHNWIQPNWSHRMHRIARLTTCVDRARLPLHSTTAVQSSMTPGDCLTRCLRQRFVNALVTLRLKDWSCACVRANVSLTTFRCAAGPNTMMFVEL